MEKVVIFQPHTSMAVDTDTVHRTVYFGLGFGLIVTAIVSPPITTTWFAIANGLGLTLVFLGIIGKRLLPLMQGTRFIHEPRAVTNTIGLLLGLGVSVATLISPPVATIWIAYAQLVAIALVTQAILGYECLMTASSSSWHGDKPVNIGSENKASPETHLPKAA